MEFNSDSTTTTTTTMTTTPPNLSLITITGAVAYPQVNGLWVLQNEEYAGNVLYEHSTESLFLYAKKGSGNWIISAVIEGTPKFYWAPDSPELPMQKGEFIVSYSSPKEPAKFVITYGDSTGEINDCL